MAQAISNLLDNAIKYSGEVKQLSITTKTLGSDLSIEIADHGLEFHALSRQRFSRSLTVWATDWFMM
ncbi:MAG: ATP-binding protein [Pyrinomonadaceae bacterium]